MEPKAKASHTLTLVSFAPEEVSEYLTAEDAAPMVKMSVSELTAAASAFQVPAVWCHVEGNDGPTPLFAVDFVRRIANIPQGDLTEERKLVIPLFNLITAYLAAYPPQHRYVEDLPVLGRAGSRWGPVHVHVRSEALCAYAVDTGADVRLRAESTVVRVLELVRARKVMGARDMEGVRIARALWRLPLTVVNPGGDA